MKDYNFILKDGEHFWDIHDKMTLIEIKTCVDVFKSAHRLPNCFWESIQDVHATNYSSLYNLTKRHINIECPGVIGNIKPTLSFLEWIYNNLLLTNIHYQLG